MNRIKTQLQNELIYQGIEPEDIDKVLNAVAVVLGDYNLIPKETNIVPYNEMTEINDRIRDYCCCKLSENCSQLFVKNTAYTLQSLFNYNPMPLKEYKTMDIRKILTLCAQERNLKASTLDSYRSKLFMFFQWLVEEEYIIKNPCKGIKPVKIESKELPHLSQDELEIIRASLVDDRERMIVEMLYSTGCRNSELRQIQIKDIDFNNKRILVLGKGKKERYIFLNAKAVMAIKRYLFSRKQESEYLLCNTRKNKEGIYDGIGRDTLCRIMQKINDRIPEGKIKAKLHAHLFRHTTATEAMHNGMPVQEVQQVLGHASINTTLRYAHVDKTQVQADHRRFVI